jgi:outer membrane lipoprotein-sorting protein
METLSAAGDLDVSDLGKGSSRKLSVRFVAARGGKLYLKGTIAVVTAMEIVADGDHFWFQIPSKKTVWTGAEKGARRATEGDNAPYYSLRPGDLVDAFLPRPLETRGAAVLLEAEPDGFSLVEGVLQEGRGVVRRRVVLSRETLEPMAFRSYDEKGDLAVEVGLSAFSSGTPRRVVILRPVEGYRATFELTKFDTNGPVPEKAFVPRIPQGYAVREVTE